MSLYLDAAQVLEGGPGQGSLKSRIYASNANLRSKPTHVYALITESSKYDTFLKEVIDNASILQHEPKVSPLLALFLVHDLLLAKGGVAASASHPLRQAIERHKARLFAESRKALVHRKYATIEAFKNAPGAANADSNIVRWVRINTRKTSVEEQLQTTFHGYRLAKNVVEVSKAAPNEKILLADTNVPALLCLPPGLDLTKTKAFANGGLILQDKGSCLPAHLLLGDAARADIGDVVDACAAPGNKTTQLSALTPDDSHSIYACERNAARSETLGMMVRRAGAGNVILLAKQDFLALDPNDPRFRNVTHLLLDPSCSGSGILRREDVPTLALPSDPRAANCSLHTKKRKRRETVVPAKPTNDVRAGCEHESPMNDTTDERLEKLSNFQLQIINHSFKFPSATRVSYSTCSLNVEENEAVVARALRNRDWKLLSRNEQVQGMRLWPHRGVRCLPKSSRHHTSESKDQTIKLSDDELEACIRCWPEAEECTMGFFVCCFARLGPPAGNSDQQEEEDWEGFSDHE